MKSASFDIAELFFFPRAPWTLETDTLQLSTSCERNIRGVVVLKLCSFLFIPPLFQLFKPFDIKSDGFRSVSVGHIEQNILFVLQFFGLQWTKRCLDGRSRFRMFLETLCRVSEVVIMSLDRIDGRGMYNSIFVCKEFEVCRWSKARSVSLDAHPTSDVLANSDTECVADPSSLAGLKRGNVYLSVPAVV